MQGAKTIYYCNGNGHGKSQQQQPAAKAKEGSTSKADAVPSVNEKSSCSAVGTENGDQISKGGSVVYYTSSAGPNGKQHKLGEVNNNGTAELTLKCATVESERACAATATTAVIQMETEVGNEHGHNNNTKIIANTKTAAAQGNGECKSKYNKDAIFMEDPLPLSNAQPEFAHPMNDAPAKCNLVDSIRTLFVDVIVSNAVSPLNFSIQSYKDYGKLKILETHMTNWYTNNSECSKPLQFQDLTLNGFYAVKYTPPTSSSHNNGANSKAQTATSEKDNVQWRRCQIIKPFSQSLPILTNLVDHGCYFMTEAKNIQPLRKIYTELPCQSLEAKLHFVDTKKIQFTPEDCHRFHKQVEGKPFCSIIMKPLQQPGQQNGTIKEDAKVNVVLIDTSGERDYYIHHDYTVPKKKS